MNLADHLQAGDRVLDMVRRLNQQELLISEICRSHRREGDLRRNRAFGFGVIVGGALMALVFIVAYFAGGAQWLK